MKVKLKHGWFAGSSNENPYKGIRLSRSGTFYKAGIHDISDRMKNLLPTSAIILDENDKPIEEEVHTLKDFDNSRIEADKLNEVVEKAQDNNIRKTRTVK